MIEDSEVRVGRRQKRAFILGNLSFGHGFSHLYDQGLIFLLPAIANSMLLSTFQVSVLLATRQGGSGLIHLVSGPFVDIRKRQWGLILTGCLVLTAAYSALLGTSPNFAVLIIAVLVSSIPGSMWHLPAMATISQRFPERRGFAISMHGFGGNIGNPLGPLLIGVLLGVLFWRKLVLIYALPALAMAFYVWWSLKDVGREGNGDEASRKFGDAIQGAVIVFKSPVGLALVMSAMLAGVGTLTLMNWGPFYLEKELEMGHFTAAINYSLLIGMGIVSTPILGSLSDRLGRKAVLGPGLAIEAVLAFLVVSTGDGFLLSLTLAGIGLFTFSLQHIILAAVLDAVGRGGAATTMGLLFGLFGIAGVFSPFLVSLLIDHLGGYGTIFYFAGILTAIPSLIILVAPLRSERVSTPAAE